jgi:hypothetical protein
VGQADADLHARLVAHNVIASCFGMEMMLAMVAGHALGIDGVLVGRGYIIYIVKEMVNSSHQ